MRKLILASLLVGLFNGCSNTSDGQCVIDPNEISIKITNDCCPEHTIQSQKEHEALLRDVNSLITTVAKILVEVKDEIVTAEESTEISIKNDKAFAVDLKVQKDKSLSVTEDIDGRKWLRIDVRSILRDWLPSFIAALIAAGATIFIAWLTSSSAKAARQSAESSQESVRTSKLIAEGEFFFELIREYSTERMQKDLQKVFEWGRKNGFPDEKKMQKAADKWVNNLYCDNYKYKCEAEELDQARQHITHYFLNILDLVNGGYVDESFAERTCGAISTSVLRYIIHLEIALADKLGSLDDRRPEKIALSKKKVHRVFNRLMGLSKS